MVGNAFIYSFIHLIFKQTSLTGYEWKVVKLCVEVSGDLDILCILDEFLVWLRVSKLLLAG